MKLWQTVQKERAEQAMTEWLPIFLDDLTSTWHAEVMVVSGRAFSDWQYCYKLHSQRTSN